MPGMTGVDVAGKIRSDHRFDDTAIIFLTSMDMVGGDNLFAGLNVQGHLMKPARAGLLRSTLSDVIRAGRQKIVRYAAATAGEAYAQRPLPQPSQPVDAPISSLDVLVAEDNDVNQIVFTQILQATGLRFAIVGNGKKALEAWETHRPAIILMDVSMPVMNGHQATQAIREREEQIGDGQRVPIIGVTAHALESDRSLCLAAGMDDYLAKPISPELLEAKVEQWLGREIPRRDTSSGSY
jgi:CheY-like chemotaxis protein